MPIGHKELLTRFSYGLAFLYALPLLVLCFLAFSPDTQSVFTLLLNTKLAIYFENTALLLIYSLLLSAVIGVGCAWLVVRRATQFRYLWDTLLIAPIAVPSYISAMVYGRIFEGGGALAQILPEALFPNLFTVGGVAVLLAFSLYPYIYIAARTAFTLQSCSLFDAARSLGVRETHLFHKVAIPAARPAIIAGMSLVAMEVLADFGASSLFGVQTFTTGIYHAWFNLFDPVAAAKLACLLCGCVLLFMITEQLVRRRARYVSEGEGEGRGAQQQSAHIKLHMWPLCLCVIPITLGFVIPMLQLIEWASFAFTTESLDGTRDALFTSLHIAFWVMAVACASALLFSYFRRYHANVRAMLATRVATLGYAIPGTVIAVALYVPLLSVDKWIATNIDMGTVPLIMTGSIAAIVIACSVRFLAVAYQMIDPGLRRIAIEQDEAAIIHGATTSTLFRKVHLPRLSLPLMMAAMLVLVDTIKELPASLMLRPFNTQTLAIRAYELSIDGRVIEASLPALCVIATGLLAVIVIQRLSVISVKQTYHRPSMKEAIV